VPRLSCRSKWSRSRSPRIRSRAASSTEICRAASAACPAAAPSSPPGTSAAAEGRIGAAEDASSARLRESLGKLVLQSLKYHQNFSGLKNTPKVTSLYRNYDSVCFLFNTVN
jgi:hypothetical protein